MRERMLYLPKPLCSRPHDALAQLRDVLRSLEELAVRQHGAQAVPLIPVLVPIPRRPPRRPRGGRG